MASTASVLPYSANRAAHLFLDVLRFCVQLHTVFFFASVKPTALPFIFEYIIQQGLTREASMSSSDREGQGFGLGVYGMMENRPSSLSMVRPPAYQSSLDASNCRRMPGQSNLRTTAHQFSSFDMGNQLPPINQPTVPMHHDMRQEPYDRAMMHSSADIRTTWV